MKNVFLLVMGGCLLFIGIRSAQLTKERREVREEEDAPPVTEDRMIPVNIPAPHFPVAPVVGSPVPSSIVPASTPVPAVAVEEPLSRDLLIVAPVSIPMRAGAVTLPPGVPVVLVRDQGPQVRIWWQGQEATVPRPSVRNAHSLAYAATPYPSVIERPVPPPVTNTQIPQAPPDRVAVSAHEVGTSKGLDRVWQTDYGSYDRNSYRTKALEVEVRNMSRRATGDCQVAVYWVGKRITADHSVFIHHGEMLPANIAAATCATARFWCPLIAAGDTKYVALGIRELDGAKIDGWFVLVSRDGHTLGGVASSPTYEQLIASGAPLERLLAAYHPDGRTASSEMPHWRDDPLRKTWTDRHATPSPSQMR